ncbi:uncharacterized protein LOC130884971 isoform X1 [Chionomys nivalis]|uniref:uncharacterized protein LOC130884950 isoform X1 n=2 Tax=Chionomys nivalis TaxID=269649 RepID=UPI002595183E|nr:uncharacterized protein LOC130884950 isoform X1 [Chionomys nivalis]XP_057642291.1 uncharacterized protein LOC130884971 isoform X1 [Chionomys nivalis]
MCAFSPLAVCRSALHYASAHNHPNVVTLLSSNDCTDINMKDDEGCTPLIKATQRDNIECISILLMHGADPHIIDANGDAALHHAICRGNITVVSKLLEYNVDIDTETEYGLTPYKLALFENQLKMAEFLIENGADAPSELTPNSGGAAAVESEQSMKKYAIFNQEENFSTDIKSSCSAVRPARQLKSLLKKSFQIKRGSRRLKDQISLSEGTMTREPEKRKKKCVTFNKEVHYNTNKKPFCRGIRPPEELKPILKSLQISGDNGRNQDQISLRLSERPHVTTEDMATTSAIKEDIDNSSSRYTIIQKQILYYKKITAMKKLDQAGLSKSVLDLSTLGEALPEFSRKKSFFMVETKKGEGFLPPPNVHDIVPQPPAHADATSTSHVSEKGDNRQSPEETTVKNTSVSERGDSRQSPEETAVNITSVSERGDSRQSPEETAVNNTSVSERGDNRQSPEETTVNNISVDHTRSLGDALHPQNANMRVLASSPAHRTSYAANTPTKVFSIWAATTSLLLLTSSLWLLKLVALMMPWVWNLI